MRSVPNNWRDIELSTHFKLGEYYVSDSHPDMIKDVVPTLTEINNFYLLSLLFAEPARIRFGSLFVSSGKRTEALNDAIHGSKDSQHLYGEAGDYIPKHTYQLKVYIWAREELKWPGELIYNAKYNYIHVGLPSYWVSPDQFIIR